MKLALSADGMIGRQGEGQVAITGACRTRQVHLMRQEADAMLVGIGTALADDPELTVRLPGLESRSPAASCSIGSAACRSRRSWLARRAKRRSCRGRGGSGRGEKSAALEALGVKFLATETFDGRIALPELLEDLAGAGHVHLMVEGGAETARAS